MARRPTRPSPTCSRTPRRGPEWPILQESGVPAVDISNWTALFAPKGTPQPILDKLHTEMVRILALPDVKERFAGGGSVTLSTTPAQLDARIKADAAEFRKIVEKANIQVE